MGEKGTNYKIPNKLKLSNFRKQKIRAVCNFCIFVWNFVAL